jgi:hypothetical protein
VTNDCLHHKYGRCINSLFLNNKHQVWPIYTSFTIWHTAGSTHSCPSSVLLTTIITNNTNKIVLDIAATAFFWSQDILYDQYQSALPFDTLMVPIHGPLWSLWLHSSPVKDDDL